MKRKNDRVEVYRDNFLGKIEWRWTRKAPNGRIVGASSEGYRHRADALANARRQFKKCAVVILASLFVGCACEKVEAPSLCDRQLELCKLDLMVCRGGK